MVAGRMPLVPSAPRDRIVHFGWSHEPRGEGGLARNVRLFTVDASIGSEGVIGFPLAAARYLGRRYGHTPGCGAAARARVVETLALFGARLKAAHAAGHRYFFGDRPTAFDIYVAVTMNMVAPLSPEDCLAHPVVLSTFEWTRRELGDAIPRSLVEHRDHMYATHLALPLQL